MVDATITAVDAEMWYAKAESPAATAVNLTLAPGESLGIVGESGSGKTTVGRMLVGALPPTHGMVRVGERDWGDVGRRDPLRRAVQMVFQDPYGSLNPRLSALQTVAEVCRVWGGVSRSAAQREATDVLGEVGLSGDVIHRYPRSLSGGQCQRVGIARALGCRPTVLIADEPTSSLDVSVQAQILNLLLDLGERHGLALALISHDLAVVSYMTTRALVMYRGRIIERGRTADLLERPAHPYTRGLVDSIPESGQVPEFARNQIDETHGCVFASRCTRMKEPCLVDDPPLVVTDDRAVACLYPLSDDGIIDHTQRG